MQGLSAKGFERRPRLLSEAIRLGLEAGAVNLVAQKRVADGGEMDADLVGASGLEPAGKKSRDRLSVGTGIPFQHLPVGDGFPAALAHRHPVAGVRMAVDR